MMDRRRLLAVGVVLGLVAGWLLLRDRPEHRLGPAAEEPAAGSHVAGDVMPAESAPAVPPATRPAPVRIVPTALAESAPAPPAVEAEVPERLGRVVSGPDDAPVPGADVVIQFGRPQGFGAVIGKHELSRTSDERGWFSFPTRSAGTDLLEASASKEGVGAGSVKGAALGMTDVVTIKLQEVRRLVLRFVPEDGSPPPTDLSFNVRGDYSFWFLGKADEKGIGVVPKFPALDGGEIYAGSTPETGSAGSGAGWFVPTEPGKLRRTFQVARAGDVEIAVPLRRRPPPPAPGTVEGLVVDAASRPVPRATVSSQMQVAKGLEATTGTDGRFRLTGIVAVKNCRVGAARGRGPMTWSEPFVLGAGATVTGVTIVIGARPDLIVDVVDPDGRRIAGVTVVVEDELAPAAEPARAAVVTGSNGRAVFDSAPGVRVRVGIDPASLPEGVGPDEDDSYSLVLFLGPREEPFVVQLRRELVVRGTVVGEDGAPIEGGTLRFWSRDRAPPPGPPPGLFPNPPPAPDLDRSVAVDVRGEFEFKVRSRWDYVVRDLRRLVRPPGGDPKPEVYDPVTQKKLLPDAPNVIVVRRREE